MMRRTIVLAASRLAFLSAGVVVLGGLLAACGSSASYQAPGGVKLSVGDCYVKSGEDSYTVVACEKPHYAEVAAVTEDEVSRCSQSTGLFLTDKYGDDALENFPGTLVIDGVSAVSKDGTWSGLCGIGAEPQLTQSLDDLMG